jgi:hypothetical protein
MSGRIEGAMSVPPVSVVGLSLMGASLQDWVYMLTIGWLTIQIGWFLYRRFKDWTDKEEE